jgi:hypothetical protein
MLDLEKIQESPHLLDILLQMEDVLDSLDIYVFKNWYLGEIAEGPVVRRYWLDFTLKYPYDKMPDPRAALRLLKHGIRVDFWKAQLKDGEFIDAENNVQEKEQGSAEVGVQQHQHDPAKDVVWMVRISIPRRLASQMSAEQMDFYDEEVDTEDVEDAKDTGIDDESAYTTDEQGVNSGDQEEAPEEEQENNGAPKPNG